MELRTNIFSWLHVKQSTTSPILCNEDKNISGSWMRSIMAVFALWTIWLAFVVHEHGHLPFNASSSLELDEISSRGSAPQHWQTWADRRHRSWLTLFAEFSLSHSSGSITFVPPIILKTTVDPSDPALYPSISSAKLSPPKASSSLEKDNNALKSRISWLERQLHLYLAIMWLALLSCVIGFVLYACFWGKWRTERLRKKKAALISPKSSSPRGSVLESTMVERKSTVESEPIVSFGHRFPIECIAICSQSWLVSCCQEGRVCLWNIETGERLLKLRRIRDVSSPQSQITMTLPLIWCIATKYVLCDITRNCEPINDDSSILNSIALISYHKRISELWIERLRDFLVF
ncbi:unnamed protein product [Strongylus vulgaris]|uniref:Sterol regulatory element-binding protein cleavage-activating protein n=1 Tax=Strongylus vulgaris TaxID=40348 RepID=A0A3P7K7E4_STRVU|nr:unnamed protein product [Strongylus vulgaris]